MVRFIIALKSHRIISFDVQIVFFHSVSLVFVIYLSYAYLLFSLYLCSYSICPGFHLGLNPTRLRGLPLLRPIIICLIPLARPFDCLASISPILFVNNELFHSTHVAVNRFNNFLHIFPQGIKIMQRKYFCIFIE